MTSKKRKKRKRKRARRAKSLPQHRRAGRRVGRRSPLKARHVAVGLVALLLVVGGGALLLGAGRSSHSGSTPEVSLDKSKGPVDAPVVVVEYGDFQ